MAELFVIAAAMNLVTAMRRLPTSAAKMTFLDEEANVPYLPRENPDFLFLNNFDSPVTTHN